MGNFFHGWRRKAGVVTLVMAMGMMGGWIRSATVQDWVLVQISMRSGYLFCSDRMGLLWARVDNSKSVFGMQLFIFDSETGPFEPVAEIASPFLSRNHGFQFGYGHAFFAVPAEIWAVPYWSIVIPRR